MRSIALSCAVLLAGVLPGQVVEPLAGSLFGPAVFDLARDRLVRLAPDGSTWEWDRTQWFRRVAQGPAGSDAQLVYEPAHRRVVALVPGLSGSSLHTYDGVTWTQLALPPGTEGTAIACDPVRSRLVLRGWTQPASPVTWELDGGTWTQVATQHTPPVPAFLAELMGFDPLTQRVVLFGGLSGPEVYWYDGVDWTVETQGTPSARGYAAVGFDPGRGVLVLHGGSDLVRTFDDVWEWDGTAWSLRTTVSGLPRSAHSLCPDLVTARLLAVSIGTRPEIASWNGSAWTVVDTASEPAGIGLLAADPARGTTVAASGTETWEWRAARWSLASTQQPPIDVLYFDPARNATVGLQLAVPAAWQWTGTWNALPAPAAGPGPRQGAAFAFDTARNRGVLFGGADANGVELDDTWEWTGTTWLPQQPAVRPFARRQAAMTYDPSRGRALLYGGWHRLGTFGSVAFDDTWSYDGVVWQQQAPTPGPSTALVTAMVFDPAAQRPVLLASVATALTVYEHDGSNWLPRFVGTLPAPRQVEHAAFDPRRGSLMFATFDVWGQLPAVASAAVTFGSPCGVAPRLAARTWPRTGAAAFGIDVFGVPGPALLALGFQPANVPLGGGCTLLLQRADALAVLVVPSGGAAEYRLAVPDDPALRGIVFYGQAAQLDAQSPIGLALGSGLRLTVGD